jgi:hypothetical protein
MPNGKVFQKEKFKTLTPRVSEQVSKELENCPSRMMVKSKAVLPLLTFA